MKQKIQCDECGRHNITVARKHKSLRFCAACYKRTFNHKPCPKCQKTKRLYDFDSDAICINCERAKPCIRCGSKEYKIGKKTEYGPVCKNCSSYFREPKPCASCGILSQRLSTYKKFNVSQPICPKCANKYRGCCDRCKRHRDLIETRNGEKICKTCDQHGYIICPNCQSLYPSGYGKRCKQCYYESLFSKRFDLNISCIQSNAIKSIFSEFSEWLLRNYKIRKAATVINKHLIFFQSVDSEWGHLPSQKDLLNHFGAEGLRHHRTVMKYLAEECRYILSERQKRDHSDLLKIKKFTDNFKGSKECSLILASYRNTLLSSISEEKIKVHTARLYLNAAKGLLERGWPTSNSFLYQYLQCSPGQKASVTKFVIYLRRNYCIFIKRELFI